MRPGGTAKKKRELTVESLLDDGKDPKVGYIQVYVLDDETIPTVPPIQTVSGSQLGMGFGTKGLSMRPHNNQHYDNPDGSFHRQEPEMMTRQGKKGRVHRCYVYACREFEDKPYYYLTRVNSRVFVVDKKKIEFFPQPGVEPEELRGTIEDFTRAEEDPSCEGAYATFQEEPATKVGVIQVQTRRAIRKRNTKADAPKEDTETAAEEPLGEGSTDKPTPKQEEITGYEVIKEKRDVFVSENSFICDPFYYSETGNKIIVMDKKRIRYLNPDGSEPPLETVPKNEMKFFTSNWRLDRQDLLDNGALLTFTICLWRGITIHIRASPGNMCETDANPEEEPLDEYKKEDLTRGFLKLRGKREETATTIPDRPSRSARVSSALAPLDGADENGVWGEMEEKQALCESRRRENYRPSLSFFFSLPFFLCVVIPIYDVLWGGRRKSLIGICEAERIKQQQQLITTTDLQLAEALLSPHVSKRLRGTPPAFTTRPFLHPLLFSSSFANATAAAFTIRAIVHRTYQRTATASPRSRYLFAPHNFTGERRREIPYTSEHSETPEKPANTMEPDPIPDDMVGSILVHALDDEADDPIHTVERYPALHSNQIIPKKTYPPYVEQVADLQRRIVYASRDNAEKPYYLTHTQNRIYVVDQTRIHYFPVRNQIPEGLVGRVEDFRLPKKAKQPKKLGYILIQVPERRFNKLEFVQQKRDVFKEKDKEEYYTICGPRRLVVEKERVHFLKKQYPDAEAEATSVDVFRVGSRAQRGGDRMATLKASFSLSSSNVYNGASSAICHPSSTSLLLSGVRYTSNEWSVGLGRSLLALVFFFFFPPFATLSGSPPLPLSHAVHIREKGTAVTHTHYQRKNKIIGRNDPQRVLTSAPPILNRKGGAAKTTSRKNSPFFLFLIRLLYIPPLPLSLLCTEALAEEKDFHSCTLHFVSPSLHTFEHFYRTGLFVVSYRLFPPPAKKKGRSGSEGEEQLEAFHQPTLLPGEDLIGSILVFTYEDEEEEQEVPGVSAAAAITAITDGMAQGSAGEGEGGEEGRVAVKAIESPLNIDKILKYAFIDLDAPPENEKHVPVEVERRYVYCDDVHYRGKAYFYSHTHNRVLVLDKRRIEMFPEKNVVPLALRGKIRDYHVIPPLSIETNQDDTDDQEVLQKVGFTLIRVPVKVEEQEDENGRPIKPPPGQEPYTFIKERRNAYVVADRTTSEKKKLEHPPPGQEEEEVNMTEAIETLLADGRPIFYLSNGRRMAAARSTVQLLLPDGSEPEADEDPTARRKFRAVIEYFWNEEEAELGRAMASNQQEYIYSPAILSPFQFLSPLGGTNALSNTISCETVPLIHKGVGLNRFSLAFFLCVDLHHDNDSFSPFSFYYFRPRWRTDTTKTCAGNSWITIFKGSGTKVESSPPQKKPIAIGSSRKCQFEMSSPVAAATPFDGDVKIGFIRTYCISGEEVEEPPLVLPLYPPRKYFDEDGNEIAQEDFLSLEARLSAEAGAGPGPAGGGELARPNSDVEDETETFEVRGIRINRRAETEFCYVYSSKEFNGALYYLTRVCTRVLVVDPRRIFYFAKPGGPSEAEQALYKRLGVVIKDFQERAKEAAFQKAAALAARHQAARKVVGFIYLQVPHKKDEFQRPPEWVFEEERRNVYVDWTREDAKREAKWRKRQKELAKSLVKCIYDDDEKPPEPEYYVLSGDRKMKIQKSRITFFGPGEGGPSPPPSSSSVPLPDEDDERKIAVGRPVCGVVRRMSPLLVTPKKFIPHASLRYVRPCSFWFWWILTHLSIHPREESSRRSGMVHHSRMKAAHTHASRLFFFLLFFNHLQHKGAVEATSPPHPILLACKNSVFMVLSTRVAVEEPRDLLLAVVSQWTTSTLGSAVQSPSSFTTLKRVPLPYFFLIFFFFFFISLPMLVCGAPLYCLEEASRTRLIILTSAWSAAHGKAWRLTFTHITAISMTGASLTADYVKIGYLQVYTVEPEGTVPRDPYTVSMRFKGEAGVEYCVVYQHKDFIDPPPKPQLQLQSHLLQERQRRLSAQAKAKARVWAEAEAEAAAAAAAAGRPIPFPFYITRMRSRVLVLDTSRIIYFAPPGGVPDAVMEAYNIKDYGRLSAEEAEEYERLVDERRAKSRAAAEASCRRVGTIKVQVPRRTHGRYYFEEERRNVFCDDLEAPERRYYTLCGARKLKADADRISFLPDRLMMSPQNTQAAVLAAEAKR
eukprot:gene11314-7846_t